MTECSVVKDHTDTDYLEDYGWYLIVKKDVGWPNQAVQTYVLPQVADLNIKEQMTKSHFSSQEVVAYILSSGISLVTTLNDPAITDINFNVRRSEISITGTVSRNVDIALQKIEMMINKFVTQQKKKSVAFYKCFQTAGGSLFGSAFDKYQVVAGFSLTPHHLNVCSNSETNVMKAYQAIEEIIRDDVYPSCDNLSPAQQTLVTDCRYTYLADNLKIQVPSLEIEVDTEKKRIWFAFTEEKKRVHIQEALESYFRSNGAFTAYSKLVLSRLQCQILKNIVICHCKETFSYPNIDIDIKVDEGLCILKCASLDILNNCLPICQLEATKHNVPQDVYVTSEVHLSRWMKSIDGVKKLKDIDTLCNTVSTLTSSLGSISASYHPSVTNGYSLSLGWLFEHWPFLYQYQSVLCKLRITKDYEDMSKVNGIIADTSDVMAALGVKSFSHHHNTKLHELHLKTWDMNGHSANQLAEAIADALKALQALTSIAIAPTGLEVQGYPPDTAAEIVIGSILDFLSDSPMCRIEKIYIVVDPKYTELSVCEEFDKVFKRVTSAVKQSVEADEQIIVKFYGISNNAPKDAMSRYLSESKQVLGKADWSKSLLKTYIPRLQKKQIDGLSQSAEFKNVHIEIDVDRGEIKLAGLKTGIESMKELVNAELLKVNDFPSHWNLDLPDIEIVLDPSSTEYKTVEAKFHKSNISPIGYARYGFRVTKISRVQNRQLYVQYQAHKERIRQDIIAQKLQGPGVELERELWHGTNSTAVRNICSQEFNRSFAGSNDGVTFGMGVYFARDASYSVMMTRPQLHTRNELMLVKVITGKHCQGENRMTWEQVTGQNCHCSVSNMFDPQEFVVYHDAAAYPGYIIEFYLNAA